MEGQNNPQEESLQASATGQTPLEAAIPDNPTAPPVSSDPLYYERVENYMNELRKEENLLMGLLMGFAASLVGAVLWGVITVTTGYQIGFMAIGIGLMVGFAVRFGGKGLSPVFGISGAILALLGCVVGNLFSVIGFIANEGGISVFDVLPLVDVETAILLLKESAQPMDFLFYAFAIYEGYRFSIRQVTEEELAEAVGPR